MQTQMLIGGRLVAGEAEAQPVYDAASGAQIAQPRAIEADVNGLSTRMASIYFATVFLVGSGD